jgi:hypothetical protein
MGLCLVDNCRLEELSEACARLARWEFMFVVSPVRFEYATGCPVTPLAIL